MVEIALKQPMKCAFHLTTWGFELHEFLTSVSLSFRAMVYVAQDYACMQTVNEDEITTANYLVAKSKVFCSF